MVDRPHKPTALSPTTSNPEPQPTVNLTPTSVTATLPTGESVTIQLHGATVTSWRSHSGRRENLWLSTATNLSPGGKAIRGGIPLVFPVFGPPPKTGHPTSALPQHGLARTAAWEYLGKADEEGRVKLDFGLSAGQLGEKERAAWPMEFALIYSVALGRETLQTTVNVRNEGQEAWEFQCLMHSYFRIGDIGKVGVAGLMGTEYVDKVLDARTATEKEKEIRIQGEVDRVYKDIKQDTTSVMEGGRAVFDVTRDNMRDTVVWNPGKEKAKAMSDFKPEDGYKQMVCVEVGCVDGWQKLEPGDTFEGGQIIKALG